MEDSRQSAVVSLARCIDLACDRFEQNWRMGRRQSLESYLVSVEPIERDAYLRALLELEWALRREQGEVPQRSEYVVRFKDDQTLVESLFESAELQSPANAGRPTVESQVGQTKTGQPKKSDGVRQVVPTEFGRYRIKHQIGAGGMGTVVLAEDTLLGRPVALKIPYLTGTDQKEQLERFDREARTAAMLRHPNICPVYDFGEVNGIRYISMAYIEGLPLSKYMRENPLDERQIARLIGKLAGALQDAHENGVVHRDLKPANIMMDKKGEPIVMDFGLAMQMQLVADVRLTQTGMQMGSPAYMPPEQVDGDKERIGPPADIYSLGVVLYELLTGHVPFDGPTAMIFAQIIMKEPIRPSMRRSGLSPDLEAICLKMMAKRIEDRYASMTDVVTAMWEIVKQHVVGNLPNNSPASSAAETDKSVVMETPATAGEPTERVSSVSDIVIVDEETELRLLSLDISNSLRDHQTDGLREKVERFLRLQPDNPAMLRLQQRLESEPHAHSSVAPRRHRVLERPAPLLLSIKSKVVCCLVVACLLVLGWFVFGNPDRPSRPEASNPKQLVQGRSVSGDPDRPSRPEVSNPKQLVLSGSVSRDPDRRAAEWALSIGGTVKLNVQSRSIQKIGDLPKEPFVLTGFNCSNDKLTDAGLAYFKDCNNLTRLCLGGTQMSDAGLAYFKDCKNLTDLHLYCLYCTQISDAGLAYFKDCKNLTKLSLSGTQISDVGLAYFKDCKNLTFLYLYGTKISDAGLAHAKDCKNLTYINLCGTKISDAGLVHVKDYKNLTNVSLDGTKISDVGLAELKGMANLRWLRVPKTQVTAAGIKKFSAAYPQCEIVWDGGVINPK